MPQGAQLQGDIVSDYNQRDTQGQQPQQQQQAAGVVVEEGARGPEQPVAEASPAQGPDFLAEEAEAREWEAEIAGAVDEGRAATAAGSASDSSSEPSTA